MGVRVGLGRLLGTGVKVVQGCTLGRCKGRVERFVFFFIKGAVQVVGFTPVIAGRRKHLVVVKALGRDDGGHGIVEMQALVTGQAADLVGQCPVGQRAGGHQNGGTLVDVLHPLPVDGDVLTRFHHAGHFGAEGVAVHGQRTAGRHAGHLGSVQQLAAHAAHFFLEQTGGRIQPLRFQAVGADQLGKTLAFVGGRKMHGLLFVQVHLHALACQPEGGFAARQTGTQHGNFVLIHILLSFSVFALSVMAYAVPPCSPFCR